MGSAHPLCRWDVTLGCAEFTARLRRSQLSERRVPLVELGHPSELAHGRAQPVAAATSSSHGLFVPSAHEGSRSTGRELGRLATGRPQGLVTLSTVSARRSRAGFFSRRQRSWDSPFGAFLLRWSTRCVSARERPRAVSRASISRRKAMGRPNTVRLLGFCLRRSLARSAAWLVPRHADGSHGLLPSTAHQHGPWPDFAGTPPAGFRVAHECAASRPLGVSINPRPSHPATRAARMTGRHRLSAPDRTGHSAARRPGY